MSKQARSPARVRPATIDDLTTLEYLDRLAFGNSVQAADGELAEAIAGGSILIALSMDEEVVGYISWNDGPLVRYLEALAVHPSHRRSGIARQLLCDVIESTPAYTEIQSATSPLNIAMLSLACSEGFRAETLIPDYFGPNHDRLVLTRNRTACRPVPDSTLLVPVTSMIGLTEALMNGYVLTDMARLPHAPAWLLRRIDRSALLTAQANESSVAVGFASVILGAVAFLLGFGFTSDSFPPDLLAALSVSMVVTLTALIIYANTTGELTSMRFGSFDRAMSIGNVLSEFGGVYPVFHIVPVALVSITGSLQAGAIASMASSLVTFTYQRSDFDILDRYRRNEWTFSILVIWLVIAPPIGYLSFAVLGTTTVWSIADIIILGIVASVCIQREESIRGQ